MCVVLTLLIYSIYYVILWCVNKVYLLQLAAFLQSPIKTPRLAQALA